MNRTLLFALATLACLSLEATSFAAPPEYRLTSLPLHPRQVEASAYSINESGDVVGYVVYGNPIAGHPFVYNLESGVSTVFGGSGIAYDINESGQVTGRLNSRPFHYDGVETTTLGSNEGTGLAINDLGHVAGFVDFSSGPNLFLAFQFDGTGVQTLGTLGGNWSNGVGINNSGVIVGSSQHTPGLNPHAFRYEDSVMEDLSGPGGTYDYSVAIDINDSGLIIGSATNDNGYLRPAIFADGAIEHLGTLAGDLPTRNADALGVNDLGAIVGRSGTADLPNGFGHAFIYLDDTMYDLNDYLRSTGDFYIDEAWEINNQGQIAGRARLANGEYRAVVLTPVPEPTTLALATVTLLAAAIAIPKKKAGQGSAK